MRLWARNFSAYCFQHSRKVANHIAIPKPDHAIPTKRYLRSSYSIRLLLRRMLTPIEFNYQPRRRAGEVGNIPPDRMLAAETHCWKGFAKTPPQPRFGFGCSTSNTDSG